MGYDWVPERVGEWLPLLSDMYYTLMTICVCRKRLGEEYTYVVKYNPKHYEEEGLLMNSNSKLLMFVLEILQRHLVKKILKRLIDEL